MPKSRLHLPCGLKPALRESSVYLAWRLLKQSPASGGFFVGLFEGLDARRDDGLGAEVGVVLLAEWLVAFAVPHFAEDAAAGARDAFDGVQGAVRVVLRFHARHEVAGRGVLEGDLSVFDEGFQHGVGGGKAAFAVREVDVVRFADLAVRQPRTVVIGDDGGRDAGDVTAYAVVGEGGVARLRCGNDAVRQQAAFDKRLEAVADAEDEAVAFEQRHHGVGDARVGEQVRHVFAGAVRFVAGAEAAREHEDLARGEVVG